MTFDDDFKRLNKKKQVKFKAISNLKVYYTIYIFTGIIIILFIFFMLTLDYNARLKHQIDNMTYTYVHNLTTSILDAPCIITECNQTIIKVNECNNSYVTGLINQVKRCENKLNKASNYTYDALYEDYEQCNQTLSKIRDEFE